MSLCITAPQSHAQDAATFIAGAPCPRELPEPCAKCCSALQTREVFERSGNIALQLTHAIRAVNRCRFRSKAAVDLCSQIAQAGSADQIFGLLSNWNSQEPQQASGDPGATPGAQSSVFREPGSLTRVRDLRVDLEAGLKQCDLDQSPEGENERRRILNERLEVFGLRDSAEKLDAKVERIETEKAMAAMKITSLQIKLEGQAPGTPEHQQIQAEIEGLKQTVLLQDPWSQTPEGPALARRRLIEGLSVRRVELRKIAPWNGDALAKVQKLDALDAQEARLGVQSQKRLAALRATLQGKLSEYTREFKKVIANRDSKDPIASYEHYVSDADWLSVIELASLEQRGLETIAAKRSSCQRESAFLRAAEHRMKPDSNPSGRIDATLLSTPPSGEVSDNSREFDSIMTSLEVLIPELHYSNEGLLTEPDPFEPASGADPVCTSLRRSFRQLNYALQRDFLETIKKNYDSWRHEFSTCAQTLESDASRILQQNPTAEIRKAIETLLELNRNRMETYCNSAR